MRYVCTAFRLRGLHFRLGDARVSFACAGVSTCDACRSNLMASTDHGCDRLIASCFDPTHKCHADFISRKMLQTFVMAGCVIAHVFVVQASVRTPPLHQPSACQTEQALVLFGIGGLRTYRVSCWGQRYHWILVWSKPLNKPTLTKSFEAKVLSAVSKLLSYSVHVFEKIESSSRSEESEKRIRVQRPGAGVGGS